MVKPLTSFFIAIIICFGLSILIITLTLWSYNTKIDIEKTSVYECGFIPYQSARHPLEIKFYLVSLLFIIFDVEVLFLFPITLSNMVFTNNHLILIGFFIGMLFYGVVYEMKHEVIKF